MALLIYFLVYLPKKRLAAKTTTETSVQTDLKTGKQLSSLIKQWEQVAAWAKEEGIDVNRPWNLMTLKKKLTDRFNDLQDQINREPIKVKYSRGTQTNSDDELESTLANLIKNIQELNNQIK